jgi:competence protein ComEA
VVLISILVVAVIIAVVIFWPRISDEGFAVASAPAETDKNEASALAATSEEAGTASSEEKDQVQAASNGTFAIYLTGAVVKPGVYELRQGSRINDAIELAGGLAEDAASNYVNLAAQFQDGQHVHIPTLAEIESGEAARIAAGGATGAAEASGQAGASGQQAEGSNGSSEASAQAGQKVNINTANSTELETLPGIGVATAQRIIDYREKNGNFKSIEGLKDVSGIGEKKYADLVDKVCV